MNSEIRNILKTCSTCKETFSSLRELIAHEQNHDKRPEPSKTVDSIQKPLFKRRQTQGPSPFPSQTISPIKSALSGNLSHSYASIKTALDGNSSKSVSVTVEDISCDYCQHRVTNRHALYQHIHAHHSLNHLACREKETKKSLTVLWKFRCRFCPAASPFLSSMEKHSRMRHYDDLWSFLEKTNPSADSLDQSMTGRKFQEIFENVLRISNGCVKSSMSDLATEARWVCEFCYGPYSNRFAMEYHQRAQHYTDDLSPMTYFCFICSTYVKKNYLDDKEKFLEHMSTEHGLTIEDDIDRETISDSAISGGNSKLILPQPIVHLLRKKKKYRHQDNWRCDYCLKDFDFLQKLQIHRRRIHHTVADISVLGQYYCSKCPRIGRKKIHFENRKEFEKHALKFHGIVLDKFGSKSKKKSKKVGETSATRKAVDTKSEFDPVHQRGNDGNIEPAWTTVKEEPIALIKEEPDQSILTDSPSRQTGTSESLNETLDSNEQTESAWNVIVKEEPM